MCYKSPAEYYVGLWET